MDGKPFLIDALVNFVTFKEALVDNGCTCYAAYSDKLVNRLRLPRIPISERLLKLAQNGEPAAEGIKEITFTDIDIDGRIERIWGYVIKGLAHPLILGKPWMEHNDVTYVAKEHAIRFGDDPDALLVREKGWLDSYAPKEIRQRVRPYQDAVSVTAATFGAILRRARRVRNGTQIMAISLEDIRKALREKAKLTKEELKLRLPDEVQDFAKLFEEDIGSSLPPHRGASDVAVSLEKNEDGREKDVPWGPLYGMSREELLVLRKTLTDLIDKNWIRASNSPAGAPVLFARKPNGGLRFCVDYRELNRITKRDRYPLPLVRETLRAMAKARWFTKLDVRAAFHRLRIREGDEWKTAFRTRFGSFEWLVCPFGLSGAPAAFQRYINTALDDLLDDFCSAYMDDVLIYTDGSRADHMKKVRQVLGRLRAAGLKLDIDKCEFAVKETKYLGFIIEAGVGIKVDPRKVEAIRKWEAPTDVRGIRSFLGFANFYRSFIENFSEIAAPLNRLTKKGTPFRWGKAEEKAFRALKELFITAPILAHWDPEKETVLEADCSGWAAGGCLSQFDNQGRLHPVAYYSKKLSPAECNYEIHDKELLAIIRGLEEWRGELKGLSKPFTILTDHKNLEYFMTTRKLTERQVRWASSLSTYNFRLQYRPGRLAGRPDAMSRRPQDIPKDESDERLRERVSQLIKDEWIRDSSPKEAVAVHSLLVAEGKTERQRNIVTETREIPKGDVVFEDVELQMLWNRGIAGDKILQQAYNAVRRGLRSFPPSMADVKASISECSFDDRGLLQWRNRTWIPEWEPLRTSLIQRTHDSHITGHPGRDATLAILSRSYYWPGQAGDVRRFCRNCDVCGRSHVWRETRKGLLRPLAIPDRFYSDLSIDFMVDLPAKAKGDPRFLMVIRDRLARTVTLEAMESMNAEACAQKFIDCHWRFHSFPHRLVSDRGSNWVSKFWAHLCELVGIERQLSTAFHPQTDGSTERANQEVLAYLRCFITYAQFDWSKLLPGAMLALNGRDSYLHVSPFFLTHGYNVEPIKEVEAKQQATPEEKRAEDFVRRLQEGTSYAQAAMASAQSRMEDSANKARKEAEQFQVGDYVWLNLKNIATPQLSKKLSWINAKYRVTAVKSNGVVELDVPSGIYPRFYVDLLKRAADDPLPSQERDDAQPLPIIVKDGEEEYRVERIIRARNKRVGRGHRREVLVKWTGYAEPNWEPRSSFEEAEELDAFEAKYGTGDEVGEDVGARTGVSGKRRKKDLRKGLQESSSAEEGADVTG